MSAPYCPGRFEQPQADRVEADHEQGPMLLARLAERLHLFQAAEEIGLLHDDAQGLIVHGLLEQVRIEKAVRRRQRHDLHVQVGEIGRQHQAIFRMDALGDQHLVPLRDGCSWP